MPCCIPTPTTDNNTSTGMIWVTLNMGRSAANRQGNDMELSGNFTLSGEWSLNYIITFVELIRIDGISGAFVHMSQMLCVNKWQTKFCLCNVGYIIQLIVSAIQSQVHNKWFISRNHLRIIPVFTRYFCNLLRLLQMLLQQLLQFFVSSGSCVNTALVCWSCGNAAERLAELSVRLQSCLWNCRDCRNSHVMACISANRWCSHGQNLKARTKATGREAKAFKHMVGAEIKIHCMSSYLCMAMHIGRYCNARHWLVGYVDVLQQHGLMSGSSCHLVQWLSFMNPRLCYLQSETNFGPKIQYVGIVGI